MAFGELLTAVGALGTAAAALFAAVELRMGRKRAQTEFEDSLTTTYRSLVAELPVGAFIGAGLDQQDFERNLPVFYRYIDLCNEQVFLRQIGRVSRDTWRQWCSGIESNLKRPGFAHAWHYIRENCEDFDELRRLTESSYRDDPRDWDRDSLVRRMPLRLGHRSAALDQVSTLEVSVRGPRHETGRSEWRSGSSSSALRILQCPIHG